MLLQQRLGTWAREGTYVGYVWGPSDMLYLPGMCGAELFPAGRGGAKERVNRLIQKFDKSAYIVMEIFVVYYDVLINENIISSHF